MSNRHGGIWLFTPAPSTPQPKKRTGERSTDATWMVIAKPHGYCSSAARSVARTKRSHEKFPSETRHRGGEVTSPGQTSVKFIRPHGAVLIKVSELHTHTHSICIPHTSSATFSFFLLQKPERSHNFCLSL